MISFWKQGRVKMVVEQDLAVVDLAGVDVEEEAAGGARGGGGSSRRRGRRKASEVVEVVFVACVWIGCRRALGAVAVAAEAGAIAVGVADGVDAAGADWRRPVLKGGSM